jgi:diguanylate cyclase (GGDEF)-like protein
MAAKTPHGERPGDAERYRVLLEIGHELAATLSEEDLYQAMYREVGKAVGGAVFSVALYDPGRDLGRLVLRADRGEVRRVDVAFRGSDSAAIRTRKPILESDGVADRWLAAAPQQGGAAMRSAIIAPMVHHGRVLGVISAQATEPDAYTEDDLHLLQGIADIAAVALVNARQFKELEKRRREAEKIEEIGRALASELDPEMVLGKVVDAALEVLDVDGVAVWLTDGRNRLLCRVAESRGRVRLPKGIGWSLEGEVQRLLVDQRSAVVLDDLARTDLVPAHLHEYLAAGSAVGVPIEVDGQVAGVLTAGSRHPNWFEEEDIAILQRLASQTSIALHNARLHANLHSLSITDPLTQLPNRRRLQIHLEHEVAAARRGRALGIAVFDIDRFKHYNDTFGHVAGDDILKAFGKVLAEENRAMNLVARYGGDEFVAALTDTTTEGLRAYVERVEARVRNDETLSKFGIHVSAGVAMFDLDQMATVNDLLRAADADMYRRKAENAAKRKVGEH